MRRIAYSLTFVLVIVLTLSGCGSVSNTTSSGVPPPPSAQADHVFLVVLENHSFNEVVGNPVMPYLNSLASAHSTAANYFSNAHPSIPNYFMLTTGSLQTFD